MREKNFKLINQNQEKQWKSFFKPIYSNLLDRLLKMPREKFLKYKENMDIYLGFDLNFFLMYFLLFSFPLEGDLVVLFV